MRWTAGVVGAAVSLSLFAAASVSAADTLSPESLRDDWLLQEELRFAQARELTVEADAAGGCNGVKDGRWGFHTGSDAQPWWQVDLGTIRSLDRVVVWNRCGGVAQRSDHLMVLLSNDGTAWRTVYQHDGPTFYGRSDNKPLAVSVKGEQARFVRLQIPETGFFHLDEVEVFAVGSDENLALRRPATQSSLSQWSANHLGPTSTDWDARAKETYEACRALAADLEAGGVDVSGFGPALAHAPRAGEGQDGFLRVRAVQRRLLLLNPILEFDEILFAKRVPGSFNHMSDQYYGWWSRPGGGLFVLSGFAHDAPQLECLTPTFGETGSFLRPTLSFDGRKVLFAWCRHYERLQGEQDKLNKANVPEDAFYQLFEMNVDGTGLRRLTQGKYDNFDGRYLPDGRIVFLSTRRGQAIQCGIESAAESATSDDLADVYVRCGGGPERPVAVYTLHTMDADGGNLLAISPFEMFEWTPSVAHDGSILYSRWDYIDRDNMPYMSMWAINPDGTNSRLVYGNFTKSPHCTFEPQCIPGSDKLVFTASGHHAQTMGSLVLLDPSAGTEGDAPITRMTPEVAFPEIEAWPLSAFANPWPLSERFYLVSWGRMDRPQQGNNMPPNCMGLYLFDAKTRALELLYRDADITCAWPMSVGERTRPLTLAERTSATGGSEGKFLLADVYRGLKTVKRGDIKSLRIVAVPAKTHPTMNYPVMGLTRDDPGKCVLGTVPVEEDGSAYFRVPSGVIVFFQALDAEGMAVQTMRSASHVQPGQTLSCVGCHEARTMAPPLQQPLAALNPAASIVPGPEGSWPFRFDQLVQPVLDKHCVRCHHPEGKNAEAAKIDLTPAKAYDTLVDRGKPSLREHVMARYRAGRSIEGGCVARNSPVLTMLTSKPGHHGVKLDDGERERLITWMDTYAQRLGSFNEEQEQRLRDLRDRCAPLLAERPHKAGPVAKNVDPR
ncbi:MAG: hypothetical protein GY851_32680 [bacterium]|nr:hypothetical protein [bacterium]